MKNNLKEDSKKLKKLNQIDRKPTQCHLWQKEDISKDEIFDSLEEIKTYTKDSHFSRRLMKCKDCGQLYLREFYEEIDWVDGEDPQYWTHVPVNDEDDAKLVNGANRFEIQIFSPRLNYDWPKEGPQKVYWVGRVL